MSNEELTLLAQKVETGIASTEELLLYIAACESFQELKVNLDEIDSEVLELQQAGLKRFWLNQNQKKAKIKLVWLRITAAAVAACVVFGLSLFFYSKQAVEIERFSKFTSEIPPGKNTATLTLENGKTIQLSDSKTGLVINSDELHYSDGSILENITTYDQGGSPNTDNVITLTASTPRGGTYQLILSDGTHVWLNADSKLFFPSKFSGPNRIVTLVGEGYFEVAHNKTKPFKVRSAGQELEVLGTHFNVNAYTDELATKTTLLTGSVRVNNSVLLPGEQAALIDGAIRVFRADVDEVVAWKNGFFVFKNSNLEEVMRQLARWYNLDVEFAGSVPKGAFNGKVYRNMNLDDVLEVLSFSKVKFKISGRKMIIYP